MFLKNKIIRLGIKSKIVLSFCILIILMNIVQVIFNYFFSKEVFVEKNIEEVEVLFEKLSSSYSDDVEIIHSLTENEESVVGLSVEIFSENEFIYSSSISPQILYNERFAQSLIDEYLLLEFSETPIADVVNLSVETNTVIHLRGIIEYDGETRYVIISKPVESIDNSISLFTESNITISSYVLIIGMIVIFIIARQITNPIKKIELVSQKIATLDFSYYANENSSTKEIASLATNINSMSNQLDKSLTKLRDANVKLKEDVDFQKKLQDERKQFIANISHEMKTPLALLQIYAESLQLDTEEIDREMYLETILEETKRLDAIVKDMLNISSIENGLAMVRKEKFNISDSVKNITNQMNAFLDDFKVKVDIEPQLKVFADKKNIEEAMRNYINNAISHVEDDGEIIISLKRENHKIVFSVYNDGKNIEEQDMKNIWESFYKSDKSRTRVNTQNAGLGLYIVKLICQNNNGTCNVENFENGVKFSLYLTISS